MRRQCVEELADPQGASEAVADRLLSVAVRRDRRLDPNLFMLHPFQISVPPRQGQPIRHCHRDGGCDERHDAEPDAVLASEVVREDVDERKSDKNGQTFFITFLISEK